MLAKKMQRLEGDTHMKLCDPEELQQWIESNDPLLDTESTPIKIAELMAPPFLTRTSFSRKDGAHSYNWSKFRSAMEARSASCPRWFVQIREEDLLLDPDGLEGVSLNCFVVAEASQPTLAPAHYVTKTHWLCSDLEDNAPERVLDIAAQGMAWRRVCKDNGEAINVFLLQKREPGALQLKTTTGTPSFGFGTNPAAAGGPTTGFSFGLNSTGSAAPSTEAPAFGFDLKTEPAAWNEQTPTAGGPTTGFGFGLNPMGSAASSTEAPAFGFGPSTSGNRSAPDQVGTADKPLNPEPNYTYSKPFQQLKTHEVLFTLWGKKKLVEMAEELKSGCRIVRPGFYVAPGTKIKLQMQNDLHDSVTETVKDIILKKLFAPNSEDIKQVDDWVEQCPEYDPDLAEALQSYRTKKLQDAAEESEEFEALYEKHQRTMGKELRAIVKVRREGVEEELKTLGKIHALLLDGKIADRKSFRILKYYADNDLLPFRPFGKVSGISEMGETAHVCVPPAYVPSNPFLNRK